MSASATRGHELRKLLGAKPPQPLNPSDVTLMITQKPPVTKKTFGPLIATAMICVNIQSIVLFHGKTVRGVRVAHHVEDDEDAVYHQTQKGRNDSQAQENNGRRQLGRDVNHNKGGHINSW